MIQAGKSITTKEDRLTKVKVEYLYHKLIKPESSIEKHIRQLRIIRQMDSRQYNMLKKQLPYIVCGIFNPPVRRTINFAYTEYFIIDIDNLTEKGMDVTTLINGLESDSRVLLSFVSPGEDGLKLVFKLKERCYDAGIYSLFYKVFVKQFSNQYSLNQVIDTSTSDVTRACFISFDPNSYFNPAADTIDLQKFIDTSNISELFQVKKTIEKELAESPPQKSKKEKSEPDDEAMLKIKELLNPNLKTKIKKKEAYVPDELNIIIEDLISYLSDAGLIIKEVINIHYVKKIRLKLNLKEAEINIFYGSKGYSVVQSPRRGTDDKLNELCADLIQQFLIL